MKEKLTLEHLAPYLPYLLQLQWYHEKTIDMSIANIEKVIEFSLYENILYKPLLHPLSKLTQEIEHNGEIFISLVKMIKDCHYYFASDYDLKFKELSNSRSHRRNYRVFCMDTDIYWDILIFIDGMRYDYVNWLISHHFDVFGLIEKRLAIEK